MAPDALEAARLRYKAAYEAYQQASERVAQKLASDLIPSAEEVDEEAKAVEQLAVVRRALLAVMTNLAPPSGVEPC